MKVLALALVTLVSLPAFGLGSVRTCVIKGSPTVSYHMISGQVGITAEGNRITIVANGTQHAVLDLLVTKVNPARGRLSVDVITLNAEGLTDANSGIANIEIPLIVNPDDTIKGQGDTMKVTFSKFPIRAPLLNDTIIFRNLYELESCKGAL